VAPLRLMEKVESKQQLGHLTPEGSFIAIQAFEHAIVELGKTQETQRQLGISAFSAIDGRVELRRWVAVRCVLEARFVARLVEGANRRFREAVSKSQ
jgi:hypothetical protein